MRPLNSSHLFSEHLCQSGDVCLCWSIPVRILFAGGCLLIHPRIEHVHPIEFWSKSSTHGKPIGTSGSCLNLSEMPAPMIFVRKQRHARLTSKGKPTFEPMQLLLKVLHKKVLNLYIYIQDIKFTTSLTSQIKTFTPISLASCRKKQTSSNTFNVETRLWCGAHIMASVDGQNPQGEQFFLFQPLVFEARALSW